MALRYILDGYNIIKSDDSGFLTQGSLEAQRERLIGLLNASHPQGSQRNELTVVFDGPYESPCVACGPRYRSGDVEVVFSEGISADERIERLVAEQGRAAETVVVTDDKGLRRMLGGSGVKFVGTQEFRRRLFNGRHSADRKTDFGAGGEEEINRELRKRWGQ